MPDRGTPESSRLGGPGFRLPLRLHIVIAFLLLFGALGLILGVAAGRGSQELVDDTVSTAFSASAALALKDLEQQEEVARAAAEALAAHPIVRTGTRNERRRYLPALATILRATPGISAAYIGWADGDFLLLRSIGPFGKRLDAPPGTAWLVQWSGSRLPRFEFLDETLKTIALRDAAEYAFDPRTRPWFERAQRESSAVVTEPYVFFTTQEPGITAARSGSNGAVAGVDLSLWDISARLPKGTPVPSTEAAILDTEGRLLAYSDTARLRQSLEAIGPSGAAAGLGGLPHAASLEVPILTALAQRWRDRHRAFHGEITASAGGDGEAQDWLATIVPLTEQGRAFVMAASMAELASGPQEVRSRLLKIFGVILILSLPLVWLVARVVARPVESFSQELDRIAVLDFTPPDRVASTISEMADLEASIATTRSSLRERIKELSCLYRVLELTTESARPVGEMCHDIALLLCQSLLHADDATARITVNGRQYDCGNWQEPAAALRAEFDEPDSVERGFVEVGYRGEQADLEQGAGPFLKEERTLVEAVATHISRMLHARQMAEKLTQAERLGAVGALTGGIAHDFNNLLTVILGNAELLEDLKDRAPELAHHAEMIKIAADRGAELTHRLLAFARKQALEPKTIAVGGLIAEMSEMLERTLGDQIEVVTKPAPDTWPAFIDPGQLENALLNLAINARDAMADGGQVVIETANAKVSDGDGEAPPDVAPGDYVAITVSDSGQGMTPEILASAFEPFFTTKETGKGSGLGLSMVYGFVRQSRGGIRMRSQPGEGTTVTLYLPRASSGAAELGESTGEEAAVVGGTERILLVEDNDLVREHVTAQLIALGYRVTPVRDGPEALQALASGQDFDLLFTDMVMPGGLSGIQLAEEAGRRRPGLPVLFTSGHTEGSFGAQDGRDPSLHLLAKPYRRRDLAAKLRQILD